MYMQKEVEAGIAFLDKKYPDWRSHINVEILDTNSLDNCIIGQIDRYNAEYLHRHGFDILPEDYYQGKKYAEATHHKLTETWKYYLNV